MQNPSKDRKKAPVFFLGGRETGVIPIFKNAISLTISLKKAEVPENCFAVQTLGPSGPPSRGDATAPAPKGDI